MPCKASQTRLQRRDKVTSSERTDANAVFGRKQRRLYMVLAKAHTARRQSLCVCLLPGKGAVLRLGFLAGKPTRAQASPRFTPLAAASGLPGLPNKVAGITTPRAASGIRVLRVLFENFELRQNWGLKHIKQIGVWW